MEKNNNKPKLRFPGFTDPWEQRKLGELVKYVVDNRGKNPKYYCENGIPIIDNFMIKNNCYPNLKEATRFIDENLFNNFIRKYDEVDDTLITLVGNGIGNIALFPKEKSVIIQNTLGLRFDENKKFMYYSILSKNKEIVSLDRGMAQPSIRQDELLDLDFAIPNNKEQNKISKLMFNIDNLITLHQRKLNHLQDKKKSLLQKMFPKNGEDFPELRFPGFTDPWEQRKLSDEVEFYSGLTYSPSNVIEEGGTFVIRSSNVKNGEIVEADNVYVNSNVANSDNVRVGDIIVVVRNGSRSLIGKHAQIKEIMNNTVIGAFMTGIHSKQSAFINALLDTAQFDKEIQKNLGATINQITTGAFKKMRFMFPDSDEQASIGLYFQHFDNLITLHQRKLNHLQEQKKALLQQMFV